MLKHPTFDDAASHEVLEHKMISSNDFGRQGKFREMLWEKPKLSLFAD